jgi:hypothetical protein
MTSNNEPARDRLNRLRAEWAQGRCTLGAMIARGYKALVVGFDWSLLRRGIVGAISGIRTARTGT